MSKGGREKGRDEEPTSQSESFSEEEEDPVTLNSSSSEEEEGMETLCQLDPVGDLKSPPPSKVHRPVTCSTHGRPTVRLKRKASKKKPNWPSSSNRKKRRG